MTGRWLWAVLVAAAVAGVWWTADWWVVVQGTERGGDFATFYYAWRAALGGQDPYSVEVLSGMARADGVPIGVHPYFYPPPFLLLAPIARWPLLTAYKIWFWVDVALAAGAAVALANAWRDQRYVPMLVAIVFLGTSAVANNHAMGQMNHLVLALVLGGWWASERDRDGLAGVLVGSACMLKMSPAFFVAWWVLRGRWRAVGASIAAAVGLSVLALAVVPWGTQVHFYTSVLPGFGTGDYNGLAVPIGIFGNHAVADVFNRVWPADGHQLSPLARLCTTLTLGLVVAGLAVAFRRPPSDARARAGQLAAVAVALLLVPVYTYEHHLVWALPAVVAVVAAALVGRLGRGWLVVALVAGLVVAADLDLFKQAYRAIRGWPVLPTLAREAKLLALLGLFAGSVTLGRSGPVRSPASDLR